MPLDGRSAPPSAQLSEPTGRSLQKLRARNQLLMHVAMIYGSEGPPFSRRSVMQLVVSLNPQCQTATGNAEGLSTPEAHATGLPAPPLKGGVFISPMPILKGWSFFWCLFLVPVFFLCGWLVSARTVPLLQAVAGKNVELLTRSGFCNPTLLSGVKA